MGKVLTSCSLPVLGSYRSSPHHLMGPSCLRPGLTGKATNWWAIINSKVHKLPDCRISSFKYTSEHCLGCVAVATSSDRKAQGTDVEAPVKPEEGCASYRACAVFMGLPTGVITGINMACGEHHSFWDGPCCRDVT